MTKWPTPPLGSLVETIVPARNKPQELDGPIPWLRIEDFDGAYVGKSKTGQGVSEETVSSMNLKVFPAGTVICSCSCSMGITAIAAQPLITNQTFIGLVPRGNTLESRFLYWSLQGFREQLNATATGAIQQYLSRDDFRQLRLPIPPPDTQQEISDFLDVETARIDALVSKKQRMIELVRERLGTEINNKLESFGPWIQLRRIVRSERDSLIAGPFGSDLSGGDLLPDGDVPILDQEVVIRDGFHEPKNFVNRETAQRLNRFLVRESDVLVTGRGTIGRAGLVPSGVEGIIHPCLLRVRTDGHRLLPEFLVLVIRESRRVKDFFSVSSTATTIDVIYGATLSTMPVPIPSIEVQQKTITFAAEAVGRAERVIRNLENQIDLLLERRNVLITAAVTGEINTSEVVE